MRRRDAGITGRTISVQITEEKMGETLGRLFCITVFVGMVCLISDVAFGQDKHEVLKKQELRSVRVGYMKIANLIDVMVAQDMGFFNKHGLNARITEFRSGSEGMAALRGGSVDITMGLPGFAMIANEQGFELVAVLQHEVVHTEPPDSGAIMVKSGSRIKTLADLKGKTIGVNALHAQDVVCAQYIMRKQGISQDSIKLVEVPYFVQANALEKGLVDAILTVDPFTTRIQQLQIGVPIAWPFVEAIPGQPIGAFWSKRTWAKQNSKLVEAFGEAMIEAIEYLNKDPDRARGLIAKYIGLDRRLLGGMPMILWDYKVQPSKWSAIAKLMREQGELRRESRPEEYFSDYIKRFIH